MAAPLLGLTVARVLDEYDAERRAHPNSADSSLPLMIRTELRDAVGAIVRGAGVDHPVKGSAGQGRWAETPWVAIFDIEVTDSAQRGFYVVYLFRDDGRAVYLTLGQGTTEVQAEYGRSYLSVLRQRADEAGRLLTDDGAISPR